MSIFKAKPLPHHILEDPKYQLKERVQSGKAEKIQEANDEFFVLNMARGLGEFSNWLIIGGFFTVIPFVFSFFTNNDFSRTIFFFFFLPFLLLSLFHLAVYYYNPQKEMVLNRLKGTISYPRMFFSRKKVTIPFEHLTVFKTIKSGADFDITGLRLILRDRKNFIVWSLAENDCDAYWSFMVYYMDKNRPLPYGDAFDAARNADFERRKAAGFPKPLYESYIETPEYTKEQQKERLLIGGW